MNQGGRSLGAGANIVVTASVGFIGAKLVRSAGKGLGLDVWIDRTDKYCREESEHYYDPKHSALFELGLKPSPMTDDVVTGMFERVAQYNERIDTAKILPRVRRRNRLSG